jgi:hypothetical protein
MIWDKIIIIRSDGIFTVFDGDFTFTLQAASEKMKAGKGKEVHQ